MGRGALLGGTTVQAEQRPKLRMLPTLTVTHPPTSTLSTRSLGSHTSRSLNESSEDEGGDSRAMCAGHPAARRGSG